MIAERERKRIAERKRKRTAEIETAEIQNVTEGTDTIVERKTTELTVGMIARKKTRNIVAAIGTMIAIVLPTATAKRRIPRPPSVASSLVKFFSAKSNPVKSAPTGSAPAVSVPAESVPAESVPAVPVESPPRSYWEASRRSGFGRVLDDGCGGTFYFDFGRLSRSIQVDSSSFEYDRFVKYVHHGYGKDVGPPSRGDLPAGTPAKFPGQ